MEEKAERGWLKKAYWGFTRSEHFLGHFLLLFMRLYFGIHLVAIGFGKWVNADQVAEFFSSINLPYSVFTAYFVGTVEVLGGISLILGLLSRFFAFFLVILFFVAYATAHTEALMNFFSNPKEFVKEEPFLYLLTSFLVMSFGPGLFSFDYWIEKKVFGKAL